MSRVRGLLVGALTVALSLGVLAAQPAVHIYLRNRAVVGYQVGSEVFVDPSELPQLLTAAELKRVVVLPHTWEVRVDGHPLPVAGPGVPIVALAQAIGFTRHESNGLIDLIPPATTSGGPEENSSRRRSEYRVAESRLALILKVLPRSNDLAAQARVERIGNAVAQASPLSNIKWVFVVVTSGAPNAACVGEGHVFVTQALLDLGVSDDELAGVLGHEIAHGVRRHPFRRVDLVRDIRSLLTDYERLQREVNSASSYSVDLANRVQAYEQRRADLQYRFDRDTFYNQVDEEEADVLGMRYAVAAGYSADGLGLCLERLEKHAVEQFGTAVLNDDMSHPPTRRRLEILKKARADGKF